MFDTPEQRESPFYLFYRKTESRCTAISSAKIKLQLANEEAAKDGLDVGAAHTPSSFLFMALEIEDLQ